MINLLRRINLLYGIKGVNIRNDNGSQFLAHDVRQFLRAAEAKQEFIHIATPGENAYIEAYHSILEAEIVQCFEFESYYEAKLTIESYVDFYNYRRLHGGINYKTPQQKWDECSIKEICNFNTSGEAESGNAGEQPNRNILMTEDDSGEVINPASPYSKNKSSWVFMPKKTQNENVKINLNLLGNLSNNIGAKTQMLCITLKNKKYATRNVQ